MFWSDSMFSDTVGGACSLWTAGNSPHKDERRLLSSQLFMLLLESMHQRSRDRCGRFFVIITFDLELQLSSMQLLFLRCGSELCNTNRGIFGLLASNQTCHQNIRHVVESLESGTCSARRTSSRGARSFCLGSQDANSMQVHSGFACPGRLANRDYRAQASCRLARR